MIFEQTKDYPRCAAFIRLRFPDLQLFSPGIYDAFVECCGSERAARRALSTRANPKVRIVRLVKNGHLQRNIGGQYSGECGAEYRNIVYINQPIGQGYENRDLAGVSFERTLLHELVHWARFVGGLPARIDDKEAGSWFEHLAYGDSYIGHHGRACS